MLGPTETSEIEEMLAKRFGYEDYESFLKGYTPPKGSKGGAKEKVSSDVESLELA
jgi:hypothetical protein